MRFSSRDTRMASIAQTNRLGQQQGDNGDVLQLLYEIRNRFPDFSEQLIKDLIHKVWL